MIWTTQSKLKDAVGLGVSTVFGSTGKMIVWFYVLLLIQSEPTGLLPSGLGSRSRISHYKRCKRGDSVDVDTYRAKKAALERAKTQQTQYAAQIQGLDAEYHVKAAECQQSLGIALDKLPEHRDQAQNVLNTQMAELQRQLLEVETVVGR